MLEFLKGRRPDITAAQIAAVLVAGVPGVATLLTTFGVGDVDAAQQEALTSALTWSAVLAAVLIGGDATLRSARNLADAKTDAAAMAVGETAPLAPEIDLQDAEVEFEDDDGPARLRRGGVLRRERDRPARGRPDRRQPRLRERRAMNIGPKGIALIKEFEGFPFGGRPYRDPVGVWTIGYGHTEGVGPHSPRLTERQASELLERDLAQLYEPHVERLPIARHLNQNQFDALVSFVYNLGPGAVASDTGIGRALRAQQWRRAADEMLRWNQAGGQVLAGLTRRRRAERELFLTPRRSARTR